MSDHSPKAAESDLLNNPDAAESEFLRAWTATVLDRPPLITPMRHYTYPHRVAGEEDAMARGALQLLVKPDGEEIFLATCALGFAQKSLPTGVWGAPNRREMCAVAGGYAYLIDTREPEISTHIPLRPVVEIRELTGENLLLFVGFHVVLAWSERGMAWQSGRLSWEGVRLGAVEGGVLHGFGWDLRSDQELPFVLDLRTGEHEGGGFLS